MPVFMDVKEFPVPEHQPDAYLSQANPVSGTKYVVLDTTKNVRIISLEAKITWATTQPTPLKVHLTIDGEALRYYVNDPVSGTLYYAYPVPDQIPQGQGLGTTPYSRQKAFLLEGRSVKVEAEIIWATTQPTPLQCRVKYAKW